MHTLICMYVKHICTFANELFKYLSGSNELLYPNLFGAFTLAVAVDVRVYAHLFLYITSAVSWQLFQVVPHFAYEGSVYLYRGIHLK